MRIDPGPGLATRFIRRPIRKAIVESSLPGKESRVHEPPERSEGRRSLRRDLCSSTGDGAMFSAMVGLGETYFAPFFVAIGASDIEVGLLSTVPYLLGSLFQLLTPWGVRRFYSFRRWVVANAILQGSALVSLALLVFLKGAEVWSVLLLVSCYWGGGLATSPVWNTWMEFLVPRRIRARFLSARMRVSQFSLLLTVTAAGFAIEAGSRRGEALFCFGWLLLAAGLARFGSSRFLSRKSESPRWILTTHGSPPVANSHPSKPLAMGQTASQVARQAIPYFAAMQFAVFISSPYFAPFMLRIMELSYTQYMLLIVLGYAGRIGALPWAGKFASRYGPTHLLLVGGIGMIPLSGLWFFHNSFVFLCLLQIVGGGIWACYELAVMLVLVEKVTGPGRLSVLSWLNTFNGLAMVSGMLLGGGIIRIGLSHESAFLAIFILSSAARVLAFVVFPYRLLREPAAASVPTPLVTRANID